MKYRAEIDGLRAIAVLAVIFYHAGYASFSGGYVGVDVFFVISGYLITSIIFLEINKGSFSLVNFYERRARRILPALYFVMLVCIPFSWEMFYPNDMQDFSKSLVAVSLFSSNILFWKESGYFDIAAELKPLLHTWSLAIEEQYYIVFPLVTLILWKRGIKFFLSILSIFTISSFLLALFLVNKSPVAAFYLLPTRAWEIAIGAITFIIGNQITSFSRLVVRETLSIIGLTLIIVAVFTFDKQVPFPSFYTLVPVLGSALLIFFTNADTFIGKFLGSKILVKIGILSYSAYLWHQPLFSFAKQAHLESLYLNPFLILITFIVAFFSWKFIEQPFRNTNKINSKVFFRLSLFVGFVLVFFGMLGVYTNGFAKQRFSDLELKKLSSFERSHLDPCQFEDCGLINAKESDWLLLGDSNAYHFSVPLKEVIELKGDKLFMLSKAGCAPVLGYIRKDYSDFQNKECSTHYQKVRNYLLDPNSPDNIIISAAWGLYVYGSTYSFTGFFERFSRSELFPVNDLEANNLKRIDSVIRAFKNEIIFYHSLGKKIYLIYPIPFLRKELTSNRRLNDRIETIDFDLFKNKNLQIINMFDDLAKTTNIVVFRPDEIICAEAKNRVCRSSINGWSLYGDRTHLSDYGARIVFKDFFSKL
jgi:peptidoglycan/LPS O-acetylase OafA/YrhL